MSGIEIGLAVASVAISAAGTAYSIKQQEGQASYQGQMARLRQSQAETDSRTLAVQSKQQEVDRQKRALLVQGANEAGAAAHGVDYWLSPSVAGIDAGNERTANTDIANIQMLGASNVSRMMLSGRVEGMAASRLQAQGDNAWIAPSIGLMGKAFSAYQSLGPTGGAGAVPTVDYGVGKGVTPPGGL